MSLTVTYGPIVSQEYFIDQWRGFCSNPGRFLQGQFEELKAAPGSYFLTRYRHLEQVQAYNIQVHADNLQALADISATYFHNMSRIFPSPTEIASGRVCPLDRVMRITQIGLIGTSAVGVVGVVAGTITAMPPVIGLSAALTAGSIAGIHAAGEAAALGSIASQAERLSLENTTLRETGERLGGQVTRLEGQTVEFTQNIDRLARENTTLRETGERLGGQVVRLEGQTLEFTQNIDRLARENTALQETREGLGGQVARLEGRVLELTQNVAHLTRENTSLGEKIERLQEGILQFSVQNENYRKIGDQFALYLEEFRRGNMEGKEEFSAKITQFTGQLTASRELWDRISHDTTLFKEGITELRALIGQLIDPRHTLIRLEEHRAIGEQIRQANASLSSYEIRLSRIVADLERKEGEIRARDQLLRDLELAHREILGQYRDQHTAQGTRHAELSQIVDRISGLVSQSFAVERRNSVSLTVS